MRYVVGDIHGCYDKLQSVLDFVKIDFNKDILYSVGDISDRGEDSDKVLEYLSNIKEKYPNSLDVVFGNHDVWLYQYLDSVVNGTPIPYDTWDCWYYNGGGTTTESLRAKPTETLIKYKDFVGNFKSRIVLDKFIIQHSTSEYEDFDLTLEETLNTNRIEKYYDECFFSRHAIRSSKAVYGKHAWDYNYKPTEKTMIIGHTPLVLDKNPPIPIYDKDLNFICIDTGAFVTKEKYDAVGCLTLLNIDTMEYFTSDGRNLKIS